MIIDISMIRPWATRTPPPGDFSRWSFFEASEYGPIEIRLFAFKLLGKNMQIRQPLPKIQFQAISRQLIKLES